jgi:CBS domain-containing protein
MICPHCGFDNLPGAEECGHCQMDLTQLDRPTGGNRVERSLMEDPVTALRSKPPVIVKPSISISDAIRLMLERDIGALLIADEAGRLIGIFSERDLLTRVAGIHDNYTELPVHRFMTSHPECVSITDKLAFALHKMDVGGYRHLPVVRDGKPVAVLSVRDMLRHITRLCKEI